MAEVAERAAWARARRVLQTEVDPRWGESSWGQRRALAWLHEEVDALRREVARSLCEGGEGWRELAWKARVRGVVAGHMLSLQRDELEAERSDVQRDDARVRLLEEGVRQTQRNVIEALQVLRKQLSIAQAVDRLKIDADLVHAEARLSKAVASGSDGSYQQILAMAFGDVNIDTKQRIFNQECIVEVRDAKTTELLGCAVLYCLLTALQTLKSWGLADRGDQFHLEAQKFASIAGLDLKLARAVAGLCLLQCIPGDEADFTAAAPFGAEGDSDSDDRTVMVTEEVEQASSRVVNLLAPLRLRELWSQRAPGLDLRVPDGLYVIKALRERRLATAALEFIETAGERLWPSHHPNRFTVLEVLMDDIAWEDMNDGAWRKQWMQLLLLLRQPPVLDNALEGVLKRIWQDSRRNRVLLSEVMLKTPFSFEERKVVVAVLDEKSRSENIAESRLAYDLLVALYIMHNNSAMARAAHDQDIDQNGTDENDGASDRLRVRRLLVEKQTESGTPFNLQPDNMHRLGGVLENSVKVPKLGPSILSETRASANLAPNNVAPSLPEVRSNKSNAAPPSAYFSRRRTHGSQVGSRVEDAPAAPGAMLADSGEKSFFAKQTPSRLAAGPERTQTPPFQSRPRRAREAMPVAASSRIRPSPFAKTPGSALRKKATTASYGGNTSAAAAAAAAAAADTTSSSLSSSVTGPAGLPAARASSLTAGGQMSPHSPMKRGATSAIGDAGSAKKQPPSTTPFKQLQIARRK